MRKFLLMGAILPAMFLTGCGDGWEMKTYDGFPYDDVRTAGHGVEYVRAHMMPRKGTKIKVVEQKNKPLIAPKTKPALVTEVAPVETKDKNVLDSVLNSGEKFFRDLQRK